MDTQKIVSDHLGADGAMISASKVVYSRAHPEHIVAFNENVCTKSGKIWWGDIDCTVRAASLQMLATALGEKVYVLRETDARFKNEAKPLLDRAIVTYEPTEV